MANLPPLTIRKPETLDRRLEAIEAAATEAAQQTAQTVESTVRINGRVVTYTVTPSVKPGRFYRLFRLDGKRTAKEAVPGILLA